jgi:1-pyrroline-5-carboxylate dehydrogenase
MKKPRESHFLFPIKRHHFSPPPVYHGLLRCCAPNPPPPSRPPCCRYVAYGAVSARVAALLRDDATAHFLARLIQRVSPKSLPQALGEVVVTRKFFENFSGDQVRFLARSFAHPGDHAGQQSSGFRWPYGAVSRPLPPNWPPTLLGPTPGLHLAFRSLAGEELV